MRAEAAAEADEDDDTNDSSPPLSESDDSEATEDATTQPEVAVSAPAASDAFITANTSPADNAAPTTTAILSPVMSDKLRVPRETPSWSLFSSARVQSQPLAWRLIALDCFVSGCLSQLPTRELCSLATAASFLDCSPLLDLTLSSLANRLVVCDEPSNVRALLEIAYNRETMFTPEVETTLRIRSTPSFQSQFSALGATANNRTRRLRKEASSFMHEDAKLAAEMRANTAMTPPTVDRADTCDGLVVPHLEGDLVEAALLRLPHKPLFMMMGVSKPWASAISRLMKYPAWQIRHVPAMELAYGGASDEVLAARIQSNRSDLEVIDADGKNILHHLLWLSAPHTAGRKLSLSTLKIILSACPELVTMTRQSDGETPLHYAIRFVAPDDVILALINAAPRACGVIDHRGRFPLHTAAKFGSSVTVLRALLSRRPQASISHDDDGWSPLELALRRRRPNQEVIQVLQQHRNAITAAFHEGEIGQHEWEDAALALMEGGWEHGGDDLQWVQAVLAEANALFAL